MNNVVRVFHVFCAPPCYLYEKQSLNLLSTPAMSLRSWPRPETGQSQLKQLGQSEALKLEETNPLLEASWQLFFFGSIMDFASAACKDPNYQIHSSQKSKISTSCQHFKCSSPVSSPVTCFGMYTCQALLSALRLASALLGPGCRLWRLPCPRSRARYLKSS